MNADDGLPQSEPISKGPGPDAHDGLIVSRSRDEHFTYVVPQFNAIGAKRLGLKPAADPAGRALHVDVYVLPNGKTMLAGYLVAKHEQGEPSK
jgi:hypothetical protein